MKKHFPFDSSADLALFLCASLGKLAFWTLLFLLAGLSAGWFFYIAVLTN